MEIDEKKINDESQRPTLIDRGRGLQLSTSRITVLDLVPYFQRDCSHEEIIGWIPSLTPEEIGVVKAYYRAHKEELDEKDREVMEYRERQLERQRDLYPIVEETTEERLRRFKRIIAERRSETNGAGNPR
ncbi:MAG: DUF433 domain-containing protein [Gemmataceae bacterium]